MDLVPERDLGSTLRLGRNQLDAGQGLRAADRCEVQGRRDRLWRQAQHPAASRPIPAAR